MINTIHANVSVSSLLMVPRLPGRLDAKGVAVLLGMQEHDIPVLVAAKMLQPLGKPKKNAVKYFAASEIQRLSVDEKWLAKATQIICDQWNRKNRNKHQSFPKPDSLSPLSESLPDAAQSLAE